MRQWINLVENALYSEVEAASLLHLGKKLYGDEAEAFYGTSDPQQLTNIIEADLQKKFANGSCALHRILNVPLSVVADMKPGMSLGPLDPKTPASWTHAWTDIEPNALHIDMVADEIEDECVLIVIEAEIPFAAVNVPLTIAQNIALYWEWEVTLIRNHPIKLIGIHRAKAYGPIGEELRPDLRGAIMLS